MNVPQQPPPALPDPALAELRGSYPMPPPQRRIFCNRTLNLRAIKAIGYDMDYTLIHYKVEEWEERAYEHLRRVLLCQGWPVSELRFDPEFVVRGLVLDIDLGNICKPNRFGYVKKAFHGTRLLDFEEQKKVYGRTFVDLGEDRFIFLNTLFSLSEACMYAQLVDLMDEGRVDPGINYIELYWLVKSSLDAAHMEGELKGEIIGDFDRYVLRDPEVPLTLLDQKAAGKKLLLITNSEWSYADSVMSWAFDEFLPDGMKWRDLFDVVNVGAGKPGFFERRRPLYEVVSVHDGLLKPSARGIQPGGNYVGGSAAMIEKYLGIEGDQILYVGDHIFTDVKLTKSFLRWRTALILRELEGEIAATAAFEADQIHLTELMADKQRLEYVQCQLKVAELRKKTGAPGATRLDTAELKRRAERVRVALADLDERISPLARRAGALGNPIWGLLLRTGNDKSHLARQLERHADVYTSRVSNFLYQTPYVYLRSPRGTLPHDHPGVPG